MTGRTARRRMTLGRYVAHRNGVPLGARGALTAMLHRTLPAGSFAGFWRYWNPVFGFDLGAYVHQPLRRIVPNEVAMVAAFAVSGAIHDLVPTLVRGSITVLFTPWFGLLGIGVVVSSAAGLDFSHRRPAERVAINLAYLAAGLLVTLAGRRLVGAA